MCFAVPSLAQDDKQDAQFEFHITADNVGAGLFELARQAHVQLLYPYGLAQIQGVHPVNGRYTVPEALDLLLDGTGFSGGLTQQGVITIALQNSGCTQEGKAMSKAISSEARRTASAVALLVGALSAPSCYAQTAAASPDSGAMETVVVTGLRSSLNVAEQIKRKDLNIVDAIVPEDVGKLPDTTVGDALQRISGVQVTRNNNQVVGVNIRGLPNVITTLNGDEIFTTTGRTYAFQNLPSEVLAGLNVYKTASADQIEGGIAGLIDVRTHRPFDFEGFQLAGSLTGSYATLVDHVNPKGNLLISDRWQTSAGEFGVLLNVTDNFEWYDYPIVWEDTPHNARTPASTGLSQNVYVPFMGSVTTLGHRNYPEANLSVQFRPTEGVEFYADLIYTGYKAREGDVFFFSVTSDPLPLSNVTLANNGCVTLQYDSGCMVQTATVGGPGGSPYTATSTQAHDFTQNDLHGAVGTKVDRGGWHLDTEFSMTTSAYHDTREIIDMSIPNEVVTLNTNVHGHGVWSLSVAPTDPSIFLLQNLNESFVINHGTEFAWAGHAKYDFGDDGFVTSLEGGLRYTDRKANSAGVAGGDVGFCVPNGTGGCANGSVYAADAFPADFFQTFRGGDGNAATFIAPSTNYLLDKMAAVRTYYGEDVSGPEADPANSFRDDENTEAVWLQAQYHTELLSLPIDGQFGFRYVNTSRRLTGADVTYIPAVVNEAATPVTVNGVTYAPGATIVAGYRELTPFATPKSNQDFLPNISAVVHLTDDLQAHLSFGKTVSRPDFASLNPALSTTPPTINRQGNGSQGNANLSPIRSTAYDVSLEYYMPGGGSVSVAGFYHNISGYIEPETYTIPYDQTYCIANGIPTTGGISGQCNIIISTVASSGTGYVEGTELSAQKFFDFLPGAWSGFGVQATYTWIQSNAPIPGQNGNPTTSGELTQVSKNNGSLILMYEKYGLSVRLAATYRSKYIESYYPGNNTYPPVDIVKPTTYLDLGVNYAVTNQISLSLDATNLLGAYYNSYSGTTLFPRDIRSADKTYALGVHFRLN
ncbi:MAG TPA: TonB-dependent receptor [Rhizomicrobium sp.]|nr:TonB-dependent receptor [Rhizomicrobium sp.]